MKALVDALNNRSTKYRTRFGRRVLQIEVHELDDGSLIGFAALDLQSKADGTLHLTSRNQETGKVMIPAAELPETLEEFAKQIPQRTRNFQGLDPIYLRRERDRFGVRMVAYYRDAEATQGFAWDRNQSRPRKGCKTVMYNCARYRAVWLPDAPNYQENPAS